MTMSALLEAGGRRPVLSDSVDSPSPGCDVN